MSEDQRYETRRKLNAQRTEDYRAGFYLRAGGIPAELPEDAPSFLRDYHDYYKTSRAYHPRSLNSNEGWNATSSLSFMNMPIMAYAGEIRNAVLIIYGARAHSRYFGEDAFRRLEGENKELLIIPGAVHTDLYDHTDVIPFEKMDRFFRQAFED